VTASITMLPEVTRKVRVPRALAVPYPLGYPLGPPDDPAQQRRILLALLALAEARDVPRLESLEEHQSSKADPVASKGVISVRGVTRQSRGHRA
jgi:hypothetical protein